VLLNWKTFKFIRYLGATSKQWFSGLWYWQLCVPVGVGFTHCLISNIFIKPCVGNSLRQYFYLMYQVHYFKCFLLSINKLVNFRQCVKPTPTGTHNCQYQSPIKPKFGWLPIRISCRSGATCLPASVVVERHVYLILNLGDESQPVPRASKQSCSTLHNFSWTPWYHGKNKLHFYEMMSALYWTNPLNWIYIVLAHSSQVDMSLHYDTRR
jgi:hypothetical protein